MNINQKSARIAGLLYVAIIISGIYAEFVVRSSLIVPSDAAATASNILASEDLFRFGIIGDIIMIMSDVAIALAFYVLLKPVNQTLSLLAAFFRLTQAIVLTANLFNLFFALALFNGNEDAMGYVFLNAHSTGYAIGLLFFGISILIVGYLMFKSGYFPKVLGIMLIVAAFGYLIDGFAHVLLTDYAAYEETLSMIVFTPAFIAELSVAAWLLFKGVKEQPAAQPAYTVAA